MSGQLVRFSATDVAPQASTPASEPVVNVTGEERGGFEGYNKAFDLLKSLVQPENWPAIGGAAGGLVGGIGGTVGGMGVGGVPGAMGGATLGGGAGESARQLYERFFGGGEVPATGMEAATDIATEGGMQGALEGAGGALVKGSGMAAKAVYRGFLKPSLSKVGIKEAKSIVQTALDEGLPIAEAGSRKANALIRQLNTEVNTLLRAAKGSVDLHQIAEKVRAFGRARYNKPGAPTADFESVMKVADTIDNHPSLGLPPGAKPTRVDVPATVANETKQTLDRAAGETAFGLERSAATEAQKQGRRVTREAIEQVEPAVAPLTARESRLIPAREAIDRAVGREANRNAIFGVPSLVTGMGSGAAVAGGADMLPTLIAAAVARSAMTPGVASRLAILAHKFSKVPGTLPADAVRIAERVLMNELGPQGDGQ